LSNQSHNQNQSNLNVFLVLIDRYRLRLFFLFVLIFLKINFLSAQLYVDNNFTPQYLVEQVLLAGDNSVQIENVKYSGSVNAMSYFQSSCKSIDLTEGLLLTTGHYMNVATSNRFGNSGSSNFVPGDKQLKYIANGLTYDAAILEFDFYPNADSISFNFFFGSEEYPEFVNKGVNDVFAFFISGPGIEGIKNLAVLESSNDPVTVDNINNRKNSSFYIDNKLWIPSNYDYFTENQWAGELSYTYTFDGFTSILRAKCNVEPLMRYHIKIAIADVGDDIYDSGVFLEAGSFQSYGEVKWSDSFESKIVEEMTEIQGIKIINDSSEIRVVTDINFLFDSYEIPTDSYILLEKITNILSIYSLHKIQICGHTDDLGSDDYNNKLSFQRAEAIAKFLETKGISKYRINYKGYGNSRPIVSNVTSNGRAKNRRVEFVFRSE
jgi:outer membrane protein OmpA-like peptidoglycan-associated protein